MSCLALNLCECAGCMACSCLMSIFSASLAQASRFGHFLIVAVTFALAIGLGRSRPDQIDGYSAAYLKTNLGAHCDDDYLNECVYRQLIYRASFSLFLLYFILAPLSYFSEYVNKSLWIIKFAVAIGLFGIFSYFPLVFLLF